MLAPAPPATNRHRLGRRPQERNFGENFHFWPLGKNIGDELKTAGEKMPQSRRPLSLTASGEGWPSLAQQSNFL
jgi:hypothetical protein